MAMMVIDVSKFNGKIDWSQVTADTAIIRIGYRGYSAPGNLAIDEQFWNNYKNAKAAGKKIGIYYMSQAITLQEAVDEVSWIIHTLNWIPLDLPIFIDSEWSNSKHLINPGRADGLSKDARTEITVKWCETVKAHNYNAGVYASTDWFNAHLDFSKLLGYTIWCAQYAKTCTLSHWDYWQYSSQETMPGINGRVDVSKPFQPSYPVLKHGSNGWWVQLLQTVVGAKPDGIFGSITEAKLKAYQSSHNLVPDGICGAKTWAVISKG